MRMVIPFGCVYLGTGSVHPSPSGRSPEGVVRLYLGVIRPPTRLQIQYVKGLPILFACALFSALRLIPRVARGTLANIPRVWVYISGLFASGDTFKRPRLNQKIRKYLFALLVIPRASCASIPLLLHGLGVPYLRRLVLLAFQPTPMRTIQTIRVLVMLFYLLP